MYRKNIFKVAFIGSSGVGKTSLIKSFLGENVEKVKTTIGIDFYCLKKDDHEIIIWDFAGQKWFREAIINMLKGASLIVMVFDLSRPRTLVDLINSWSVHVKEICGEETFTLVVGNKKDIKKINDEFIEEGLKKLAEKVRVEMYIQTSALYGENVSNLFQAIFEIVKLLSSLSRTKKSMTIREATH